MKLRTILALVLIAAPLGWKSEAQIYDTNTVVVETFAGSGFSGYLDGQGTLTMFDNPSGFVVDSSSNLFVWDANNYRIRKITPNGTVSTFVGGGTSALPGSGTSVSLSSYDIYSLAIDHSNTLWGTLPGYPSPSALLRIRSDNYVSTITLNGVSYASGICVDSGNNIYVSDYYGQKIYRYSTNAVLQVFVGSGNIGAVDGNGIFTSFFGPKALAADAADNIYVWDSGNYLIRRINQNRDVITIAGHGFVNTPNDGVGLNSSFNSVSAMCVDDSGNLILTCNYSGSSIRKMDATTKVTTIAGSFSQMGYTNGSGNLALFNNPSGVCVSQGTIFVADAANNRIRSISFNPSSQPVLPADLQLSAYPGLQITGTVGRTYQIQSSTDLTNWTTTATLLLTSSPYLWIDQNPVSGNTFYRAFLLP